jgi:hypothetical protein
MKKKKGNEMTERKRREEKVLNKIKGLEKREISTYLELHKTYSPPLCLLLPFSLLFSLYA